MLIKLEREGKIHGAKIGRTSPAISHLFFADDILLFCRVKEKEVRETQKCLGLYCRLSGQKINIAKFGCFFSKNKQRKTKAAIKKIFGFKELTKDSKNLGNPLFTRKNHSNSYEDLRRKIDSKLQG